MAPHGAIAYRFEPKLFRLDGHEVHAASSIAGRRIHFHRDLRDHPAELRRIAVHEIFHFAWVRLGNPRRWSFEELLAGEIAQGARGELGWSAELQKNRLRAHDPRDRTRRWREYACESFCDTAAWVYAASPGHDEYTLAPRFQTQRRHWFAHHMEGRPISL